MSLVANTGFPALVVQVMEAKAAANDVHAVSCLMPVHNTRPLHRCALYVTLR
jgi:hypothetical protein